MTAYPNPDEFMLLAYKPLIADASSYPTTLRLASSPDIKIPPHTKLGMAKCSQGHTTPAEDCNCGVYLTLNFEEVNRFVKQEFENQDGRIPVMGIFQVLEDALLLNDYTLRAKTVFLWGIVVPLRMAVSVVSLWTDYRPVLYRNIGAAHTDVYQQMQCYGINQWR